MLIKILVCIVAGLGAGIGTGLAGLSAATIITPMLVTFLGFPAYEAVAIALASDVLASAASAATYAKNKNIDIKNGIVMMISVLFMTMVGSVVAKFMPNTAMSGYAVVMTVILGFKFLIFPVNNTPEKAKNKSAKRKLIESLICGCAIGFVCGFVGAGGGMMMLFILTTILGYELKCAVGTSVFVMTFTAFTGAASHVVVGGVPDVFALILCIVATLGGAELAALFANKTTPKRMNQATGIVLIVLGSVMVWVNYHEFLVDFFPHMPKYFHMWGNELRHLPENLPGAIQSMIKG